MRKPGETRCADKIIPPGIRTALQAYDERGDLEPLYAFLIGQTEKTWEKTLTRDGGRPGRRSLSEQISGEKEE